MKIKRFEAPSMSEALRLIKKEFGDEAVILSAKSQKKNRRFLGKKEATQVVVTAAIDKEDDFVSPPVMNQGSGDQITDAINGAASTDREIFPKNSIFKRFKPITKTGQKILKPKFVQPLDPPKPVDFRSPYYQRLRDKGLNETLAAEWDQQIQDLQPLDEDGYSANGVLSLSQAIQAKCLVGTHFETKASHPKYIIMIGPSGAGKTSAVAKMAAKQAIQHPESVAILSLDNQRVAGSAELERFAPIIGVPFKKAFRSEDITSAISEWGGFSHIVVDTPAVSLEDPLQREKLRRLLESFENAEHLLVINSAIQEKTMARMIHYFKALEIQSLCFTSLDWCVDIGALVNKADKHQLPIGFISDSPKIGDALKSATSELLAELLVGDYSKSASDDSHAITMVKRSKPLPDRYYVANRNSDIFHFHECKSVKRINTDNMIVFKDSTEAMGQQFKPCRMCCSELIVPQTFNRLARGYAGSR